MLMTLDVWNKLDPLQFMLNKRKNFKHSKVSDSRPILA